MRAYDKIMAGLNEALAYERGEIKATTTRMTIAPLKQWSADEIKQIRIGTGLSQRIFAQVMGVSDKTVEAWEAGRNVPSGPAGRMLYIMQQDPQFAKKMEIITEAQTLDVRA